MLSSHPEIEAEKERLSEEVHKQCKDKEAEVASYLPDEENKSEEIMFEEITSEEFHGESHEFTEKELKEEANLEEQYTEQETVEYKTIDLEIRLNGDDLVTMDDTEKTVEKTEEVANGSSTVHFPEQG